MVRRQPLIAGVFLCLLLFMSLSPIANSESLEQKDSATEDYVSARSTTTWSGIVDLTSNYYVDIQDELLITSCTNVTMSSGVRIVVDGRITIQGTPTCPVVLSSSSTSTSDHEGIQFNSSSNGRGSIINHLHIEDSIYGLTLYGSDPVLNNVTIFNPDRVGIDMFGSSSPVIRDLHIEQAGRLLPFQNDWRYGIGMSVGSGSTPIVERAYFTDHLLRGLNLWGGSGGIFRDIVMDNISGATLGEPTGVWVEDSVPLFEDLRIDKSDTGIIVRHIDDSGNTRGVFRDVVITNSMYRGVYIDKDNHFNYTNYETADFTNLSVLGTGSAGAKTANIAEAAIEVNATGAWLENVLVDDSSSVGVRLHYVDSSTTFRNLTINDAGDAGKGPHSAGLAITSSYFAAHLEDVEISGSPGPALWSSSGGAVQGSDWHFHNNSEHGLYIDSATVVVDGLDTYDNGYSGAHVYDSRYVTLTNVTSENDGSLGVTPLQTAGLSFKKSNDLESTSGDVTCRSCAIHSSSGHGVYVEDSVDLWLENLTVSDIGSSFTPVYIDNGGLTTGSQGGRFHILSANIQHESTTEYAVYIEQAAGQLDDITIDGNHSGIFWDANHNGAYPSTLSNTVLQGTECLKLVNHPNLGGYGNTIDSECTGDIFFENTDANFSNLLDSTGSHILDLDASSTLHLHQPNNVDLTIANIPSGATIDVAWDVTIWVVNNLSNGVPSAFANVTFSQFEPSVSKFTNDIGTTELTDFIGQRWSNTGASTHNDVTVNCGYDSVSNSTTAVLNSDQIMYCRLDLDNQEPFLMWTSPQDGAIFPSQGAVVFNASDTWDLDEDELTFSWSSNLDGDIESSCSGTWVSPNGPSNGVPFTANTNDQWACGLSDGLHTLTLEVCDDAGHCVSETRTIELTNLAPELNVTFEPGLTQFSELIMPQTGTVVINTTGTFDPEGDDFACLIQFGGYNRQGTGWGNVYTCPQELSYTFDHFTDDPPASFFLTVIAFDDVGNNDTYSVEVKLYNEMPESSFTLERNGTASEDIIFFNGSSSYDPEGNDVSFEWWSNVDGTLMVGNDIDNISWDGYLSRGVHLIELRVTDNRMEHGGQMSVYSELITIDNSVPKAVIEDLDVFDNLDSSILIPFSANGSGDWDSACSTFPTEGVWHCSEIEPAAGSEFLQIVWVSDVDGLLTPEGEDWLTFEERLSPGEHVITLSISDGINPVVTTIRSLSVSTSAPVLGLDSPQNNSVYSSSEMILFDARSSIDYDGDEFTMTVREYDSVTETYVPLLTDVNASITHSINLDAGEQDVQIELIDSTGAIRIEYVHLIIEASDPVAVILSPSNLESIDPGATILFEGDSSDADGDLVVREWRLWPSTTQVSNGQVTVLSTQSTFSQVFAPGSHHISLYVEDARGAVTQDHINFTVRSSLPELVRTSLQLSQTEFVSGEIVTLEVSIQLIDADGSTDDVRVEIDHLIQSWSFNLSDADGDSVWTGSIEFQPEGEGSPSLKVIATDGEGDNANIDILSEPLKVVGEEADGFLSTPVLIGAVSLVLLVGLLITIQRRRQANAEMKLIDTWGVFGNGMEDETDSEEKESDNSEEEKLDWDNV
ncbi:right-handed parallel beta-helix repeat-containing protein [Candidatus Poseidoniales archaeon]|nr:right-handed parallel beta-helix repeat-containing protein [Candidatus Poseidoniales archaeon]